MVRWPPHFEWDVLASGLLPADWEVQIRFAVQHDGMHTLLSGESEQSREAASDYSLPVIVVPGQACARRLPWLAHLYENELLKFVSKSFGHELFVAKDLQSSININCLRGVGARYESHVDTNPVTGLLFASDGSEKTGGELVFTQSGRSDAVVWPRRGVFIAFDAREIPHVVAPLKVEMDRLSIPMNYYDHPTDQNRPVGLDERLYTPR